MYNFDYLSLQGFSRKGHTAALLYEYQLWTWQSFHLRILVPEHKIMRDYGVSMVLPCIIYSS